jgi:small GTP-binding protein
MIKKKICILGAFAVGKTSLVERFVKSIFSDKYHTTIGVKTDQKDIKIGEKEVRLILWDINGEDDYQSVKPSYLMGTSAFILVADGTRKETLKVASELKDLVFNTIGEKDFYLLINKVDLSDNWEIEEQDFSKLAAMGWKIVKTSAKTGENVEQTFTNLALELIS